MKVMSNGKVFNQGSQYQLNEKRVKPEYVGHANGEINEIHANPNLNREQKIALAKSIINGTNETAAESKTANPKKFNLSAICKTANTLRKQGYTLSQSFVIAWTIAKGQETKVSGTTFQNRQTALERLMKYQPEEVKFILVAEPDNQFDKNAVAVMVSASGSKEFKIGYIPAVTAPIVAAILNRGINIKTSLKDIIGGYAEYAKLGLRLNMSF